MGGAGVFGTGDAVTDPPGPGPPGAGPPGAGPPTGGTPTPGLQHSEIVYEDENSITITYSGGGSPMGGGIPIGGGRPGIPKRPGKPTGPGKARGAKGMPERTKNNRIVFQKYAQMLSKIPIGNGGNGMIGKLGRRLR